MNDTHPELLWPPAPAQRQLSDGDVHVWAADLDKLAGQISPLEATLSADELDRAKRFHSDRDRNRFIAGRGLLRTILGSYLKIVPGKLKFAYGSQGKPALAGLSARPALHFNVAHSGPLILIAATRACAIGVDVEWIRPMNDAQNIAARFFSTAEAAKLKTLPENQLPNAFLNLWTHKEAFLKATGDGLSDEMIRQIEVSFLPDEKSRMLAISGNTAAAKSWMLQELIPATGFTAAFAAQAKDLKFSCWRW